jgi:succinate dehydrogenase / fumarate reductase, cytochrome b subunit
MIAPMNEPKSRPLSPHLQVYRLPMAALMSITHRITGVILSGGFILVTLFLVCAAIGEKYYTAVMNFAQSGLGLFILIGWSLALYYHTFNGIRHLVWDWCPSTISKDKATASGWFILIASAAATALTWMVV